MRYVFRFWFVVVLSLALVAACGTDENGEGGTGGGTGGSGGTAVVLPCTEEGLRNATAGVAERFTFDCDGPTTVVTEDTIVGYGDAILDGQGNLTVDGNNDHGVFQVSEGGALELRNMRITNGRSEAGGGIQNKGILKLVRSTVSGNAGTLYGGGIDNWWAAVTLTDSTVSGNTAQIEGGGIRNVHGTVMLTNTTVSGNAASLAASAIQSSGTLIMVNATVSGNIEIEFVSSTEHPRVVSSGTLVRGECDITDATVFWTLSQNIESPGNTCRFDQSTGLVNVSAGELALGPLQDNGGPTETHALGAGSVAIDQIPAEDCVDADGEPLTTDQRGEPRPETGERLCDVGAFELQL